MQTICPPLDVPNLPYARRQLIIVQTDQIVAAAREATVNAQSHPDDTNWMDVTGRVAKAIILGLDFRG